MGLGIGFRCFGQRSGFRTFGSRDRSTRGYSAALIAATGRTDIAAALFAKQGVQHPEDRPVAAFAALIAGIAGIANRFAGRFLAGFRFACFAAALFAQKSFERSITARIAASRFARVASLRLRHGTLDRLTRCRTRITAALLFEQVLQAAQQVVFGLAARITARIIASRFTRLGFRHTTFNRLPARIAAGAAFQAS